MSDRSKLANRWCVNIEIMQLLNLDRERFETWTLIETLKNFENAIRIIINAGDNNETTDN